VIIDTATAAVTAERTHDVCVVGAGAAGLALAREFVGRRENVCLLEAGGLDLEAGPQDRYEGSIEGPDVEADYLTRTRLSVFGGSMMAWGGLCRPLDEIDFEPKPWLDDYPGWPFRRKELVPFYNRASEMLEVPPFFGKAAVERFPFPEKGSGLVALPFQFSPTYPGQAFRPLLEDSPNVTVYLHATALEIVTGPKGGRVERLRAVSGRGREMSVKARVYILCLGGIDTPRIMLNSDGAAARGVGNGHDLVGRYFMSHFPITGFGRILFLDTGRNKVNEKFGSLLSPTLSYLAIAEETRRRDKLVSTGFQVNPDLPAVTLGRYPAAMEKVYPIFESYLRGQVFFHYVPILAVPEHTPNRDSRIVLSKERDATGMRRIRLVLRRSPIDMDSLRRSSEALGRELGRLILGRVQTAFIDGAAPPLRPDDHHLGSTRMHADPKLGVVDSNCRVHGVENLYVSGPSVFPSGGFANPVLTIMALAIRLADHLKKASP
jgi:choline dehydrogenase-like flavoprotein